LVDGFVVMAEMLPPASRIGRRAFASGKLSARHSEAAVSSHWVLTA
jgi:hypothetical protein